MQQEGGDFSMVLFFFFRLVGCSADAVGLKREKVRSVEKKVMNKIIIIVIQYTQLSK